jgi:hypothetical protein
MITVITGTVLFIIAIFFDFPFNLIALSILYLSFFKIKRTVPFIAQKTVPFIAQKTVPFIAQG